MIEMIKLIKYYVRSDDLLYLGLGIKFDFQDMLIPCQHIIDKKKINKIKKEILKHKYYLSHSHTHIVIWSRKKIRVHK